MGSCLSSESKSPLLPSSPLGIRKRKNSKKRIGSWNSSFDYRSTEQLHRIPGQMFLNGSTEVASLFTQQGKKGTNQDAMIVWEIDNIRLFPDLQDTINYARMLEDAGCSLLAIHGRTRDEKDGKKFRVDWNAIKAIRTTCF